MPRLVHEPWCDLHDGDPDGEPGRCNSESSVFGPVVDFGEGWTSVEGGMSLTRDGEGDIVVFIDYRTPGASGTMDVTALRAVREAVVESPTEFLTVLDELLNDLSEDAPEARAPRDGA